MSVGGWIIEIVPGDIPGETQISCVNREGDETAVLVEPAASMPSIGDEIWWQDGRVYFDGDKQSLRKIGNSFDPTRVLNRWPLEPKRVRHLDIKEW